MNCEEKIENLDVCKMTPVLGYHILESKSKTKLLHFTTLMCVPISGSMMIHFRKYKKMDMMAEVGALMNKFKSYDKFIFLEVTLRFE